METELCRYGTFGNFPQDSPVMPSRLAKSGFYSTGKGEQVICFSCRVQVDSWDEGEDVSEVHRRLSPGCEFVGSLGVGHFQNKHSKLSGSRIPRRRSLSDEVRSRDGAKSYSEYSGLQESCVDTKYNENSRNQVSSPGDGVVVFEKQSKTSSHLLQHFHQKGLETQKLVITTVDGQIALYPGISEGRPEHPDYALLSSREASYINWPAVHPINPSSLVAAGFYYAGVQDCVRCFYCSSGLKNFESGDQPWVEHARFSPQCAYVKLCKGERFVHDCTVSNSTWTEHLMDQLQNTDENVPSDWLIRSLNSVAAKLVINKGYSQRDVENAIKTARQKYGEVEINARLIMENLPEHYKPSLTKGPNESDLAESSSQTSNSVHTTSALTSKSHSTTDRQETTTSSSEYKGLLEENRRLKDLVTCKICMDSDACVAFLPCGHLVTCLGCSKTLNNCPICRSLVQGTIRVYQA